jgi:hypothetical protein
MMRPTGLRASYALPNAAIVRLARWIGAPGIAPRAGPSLGTGHCRAGVLLVRIPRPPLHLISGASLHGWRWWPLIKIGL